MRKLLYIIFKAYMHKVLVLTRASLGISQEEMAHRLNMSARAYAALESKKSACGLVTLIIFVLKFCPDRGNFFERLFSAFDEALKNNDFAA